MGYTENTLSHGEKIISRARLHWIIYLPCLIWTVIFIIVFVIFKQYSSNDSLFAVSMSLGVISIICFIAVIYLFVKTYLHTLSTELAITTKRIIAKTGIFNDEAVEFDRSKIETVMANQSQTGKRLNYGTITLIGTGGTKKTVARVKDPVEFRKKAVETIESWL